MTASQSTKKWIGLAIGLQVIILLTLWGGGPAISPAQAQGIPDSGAQLQQVIEQLKAANAKMDRIAAQLSGGLEVKVRKSDEADGKR